MNRPRRHEQPRNLIRQLHLGPSEIRPVVGMDRGPRRSPAGRPLSHTNTAKYAFQSAALGSSLDGNRPTVVTPTNSTGRVCVIRKDGKLTRAARPSISQIHFLSVASKAVCPTCRCSSWYVQVGNKMLREYKLVMSLERQLQLLQSAAQS